MAYRAATLRKIYNRCLQKVHPVGRFIAAGFSGPVAFGSWAVADLRNRLYLDDPETAWKPGWVAFKWYRRARRAFAAAPDHIRRLGASFMLVGSSTTVKPGGLNFARPIIAILRSPDFFPRILKPNAIEAIGSGSLVDAYIAELRHLATDRTLMQMEVNSPGGYGHAVMHTIRDTIEKHPEVTVSPYVHLCIVRLGSIAIEKSDYTILAPDPTRQVRMPPVATNWLEFEALARAAGTDAEAAAC